MADVYLKVENYPPPVWVGFVFAIDFEEILSLVDSVWLACLGLYCWF